jgi:glycosyltransferase involved in cell wall biosynthesis
MKGNAPHTPVSVVIPCYCCSETIERAVSSVINQTQMPVEIWLVDDASPDDGRTLNKLYELKMRYADTVQIEVIALPINGGPSVARNTGWDAATQPYITFLDADDAWHTQKLEIQYEWMKEHPEIALTGHKCLWLKEDSFPQSSEPLPKVEEFQVRRITKLSLLFSNRFSTPSVMLKNELPFRFEPQKRYSEDYLLWLQIALSGYQGVFLDLPLAYLYKAPYGEEGLSSNLWNMEKGELDTYHRVHKEGYINLFAWLFLVLFSLAKFCRRVFKVYLKKITRMLTKRNGIVWAFLFYYSVCL